LTLSKYVFFSVSTLISSPTSRNPGTEITAPHSSVAGLVNAPDVFPFIFGSVSAIFALMVFGISKSIAIPSLVNAKTHFKM